MKKLIASCFTEIIFSLKTPSEIYCWQQTMVCQVGCPRYNHKSSIISALQAPPSFKSGRLPRDSFNWLNLIFCEPLLYPSDRFNFPSPASTHIHIRSSSVMYIFLRVLGAFLHSFRHLLLHIHCAKWRHENWNIQQHYFKLNLAMPVWASAEQTEGCGNGHPKQLA